MECDLCSVLERFSKSKSTHYNKAKLRNQLAITDEAICIFPFQAFVVPFNWSCTSHAWAVCNLIMCKLSCRPTATNVFMRLLQFRSKEMASNALKVEYGLPYRGARSYDHFMERAR